MQFPYGETILDIMPTKQPYLLVIWMFIKCNYIINHVYLCFTGFIDGSGEIRVLQSFRFNVLITVLYYSIL